MDAIQNSITQLQQLFVQRMDTYQGELQAATPSASIAALNVDFSAFRTFIMNALRSLQEQVSMLSLQFDNFEMRSRRKILLLHGVPEMKNEDTGSEIVKIITSRLKIPQFNATSISRCHRMGRMSNHDRPRPILFKLTDLDLRNKIWHAKSGLKGSAISLSEFLTKSRHEIFTVARQKFGVTKCWTREGVIFVLGANGNRHRVNSLVDLQNIIEAPKTSTTAVMKEPGPSSKSRRAATIKK